MASDLGQRGDLSSFGTRPMAVDATALVSGGAGVRYKWRKQPLLFTVSASGQQTGHPSADDFPVFLGEAVGRFVQQFKHDFGRSA